jgi:hypothetical protein
MIPNGEIARSRQFVEKAAVAINDGVDLVHEGAVSGTVCTHEDEILLRDFHGGPATAVGSGIVPVIFGGNPRVEFLPREFFGRALRHPKHALAVRQRPPLSS